MSRHCGPINNQELLLGARCRPDLKDRSGSPTCKRRVRPRHFALDLKAGHPTWWPTSSYIRPSKVEGRRKSILGGDVPARLKPWLGKVGTATRCSVARWTRVSDVGSGLSFCPGTKRWKPFAQAANFTFKK